MGRNRKRSELASKRLANLANEKQESEDGTSSRAIRSDLPHTMPTELNMNGVKIYQFDIFATDMFIFPRTLEAGNVQWRFSSYPENDTLCCTLRCDPMTMSNIWKISAYISVVFKESADKQPSDRKIKFPEKMFRDQKFDENNTNLEFCLEKEDWDNLKTQALRAKEIGESARMAIEVQICVNQILGLKSRRRIAFNFSYPTTETDVIFKFGEKLLYLNCSYLAMFSEYFSILHSRLYEIEEKDFNGLPIQKMEENFYEFHELMEIVYPSKKEITDSNVEYILRLADRFTLDATLVDCEKFLINKSKNIDVFTKLHWASIHYLTDLQDHCLSQLKDRASIVAALESPIFPSLSLEVVTALFKLLAEKDDSLPSPIAFDNFEQF